MSAKFSPEADLLFNHFRRSPVAVAEALLLDLLTPREEDSAFELLTPEILLIAEQRINEFSETNVWYRPVLQLRRTIIW